MTAKETQRVSTVDVIEALGGAPMPGAIEKVFDRLDKHARHFISLSPFLCLSTIDADGRMDVSPRGDPPGFVAVLDDRTILIPERPGNRRHDSMRNLIGRSAVAVIFFVPGIDETLRLCGRATVTKDPELLAGLAESGHTPVLGIRIEIDEVFFHCARAIKRARLWDPASRIERRAFPSMGKVIKDQLALRDDENQIEAAIQESYRTNLYREG